MVCGFCLLNYPTVRRTKPIADCQNCYYRIGSTGHCIMSGNGLHDVILYKVLKAMFLSVGIECKKCLSNTSVFILLQ